MLRFFKVLNLRGLLLFFRPKEYRGINESELDVLNDVKRITHHLFVQSSHLKSLRFLRNLEKIDGRKKHEDRYALMVSRSDALVELGLRNLEKVMDGDVYVGGNPKLCFAYTLPWESIAPSSGRQVQSNRPAEECRKYFLEFLLFILTFLLSIF